MQKHNKTKALKEKQLQKNHGTIVKSEIHYSIKDK